MSERAAVRSCHGQLTAYVYTGFFIAIAAMIAMIAIAAMRIDVRSPQILKTLSDP